MSDFVMGAKLTLDDDFSDTMSSAARSTQQFKATTQATQQAVSQMASQTKKFSQTVNATHTATTQATQGVNTWKASIQQFNRGAETLKNLPGTIKQIASQKLDGLKDSITSTRLQASLLAASLQTVAKKKLTGAVNSFKEFKNTVTEGKSGLSGFATGLKNVGKISIAKTVNAVKQFKPSFAAAKAGASALLTGIKSIAKSSLSSLHSGIKKVGTLAKEAGTAVTQGLGKALKSVAKALAVGIGAAATAVGALVTKSVGAFADYEQLTGGVETLFKDSAGIVQDYANNAFKTAGLSANDYMETVTGFSASLLQSVGGDTEKAARYADLAISDMADNANKMGTGMESIQNAYQGFAKQNYTMLDNLKLGYGGTKEEMQRLLSDAAKLTGKKFDLSSYSDIVQAIHTIQENMDITGTTAKEAEQTISGSAASMKAAWGNMLVSLTTGGESFDVSIANLVSSVKTFGSNIIPAITKALSGVGQLIEGLAPMIAQEIPTLINSVLPPLINAAAVIMNSLVNAIPGLISTTMPSLVKVGMSLIDNLLTGIETNISSIASGVSNTITVFVSGFLKMIPRLILVGAQLLVSVVQGIAAQLPTLVPVAVSAITTLVDGLLSNIDQLIIAALDIINGLISGLIANIPLLVMSAIQLVQGVVQGILNNIQLIINAALDLINALINGLLQNLPMLLQASLQLVMGIVDGLVSNIQLLVQGAILLIQGLVTGILQNLPAIIQAAVEIVIALAGGLIQAIPQLIAAIPQLIAAIVDTILNTNWLDVGWQIVKGIGTGLLDGVKSLFGGGKDNGKAVAAGTVEGLESNLGQIQGASTMAADALTTGMKPDLDAISSYGSDAATSLSDGVTNGMSNITTPEMTFSVSMGDTSAMDGFKESVVSSSAAIQSELSTLKTAVEGKLSTVVQSFQTSTDRIQSIMASCNLYSSGVAIMQGLSRGIESMRSSLMATARSIANGIKTEINAALDINSPSRVTEDSGENTGAGLIVGIRNMIDKVRAAAYDLSDTAAEPFTAATLTPTSVNAAGTPVPATPGRGGLLIKIENMILHDVGNKDPQQLVSEILQLLYERLADADEILSSGEMGALL